MERASEPINVLSFCIRCGTPLEQVPESVDEDIVMECKLCGIGYSWNTSNPNLTWDGEISVAPMSSMREFFGKAEKEDDAADAAD